MDSFSELTDQLFVHKKEGWAFCSHYSDIEHSSDFDDEFECRGLLSLESLEQSYREYFDWLVTAYPNTQVIFINFPASLDGRDVFKRRAEEIGRVIDLIAREYDCIHVLSVDASDVVHADGDSFPYHFGKITNMAFVTKWGRVLEH